VSEAEESALHSDCLPKAEQLIVTSQALPFTFHTEKTYIKIIASYTFLKHDQR